MDLQQLKNEARGKWASILENLGISVGDGRHTACPVCGGKNRFRFDDKNGDGTFYCNQCDKNSGDGFTLVQNVLGVDFKESMNAVSKIVGHAEPQKYQKEKSVSPEYFRKILKQSTKIKENDTVHKYLQKRGLHSIPHDIWTTSKCYEPETKQNQNAMLAIFREPDGTANTIHRSYLDIESNKLDIDSPKKILPPMKPMVGGAVRLFEHEGDILGIAEGIETAISVHEQNGIPCWAALTSKLLEKWIPPKDIKRIAIFADNDANFTGQKAAYILANRLVIKNKLIVYVETPEKAGTDFLDETIK